MAPMPRVTLQDGAQVELPEGEPVGAVLPPEAIAARVDGELRDLSFVPAGDAAVQPVDPASEDGLHVIRHSTAHVLAQAVCRRIPEARYAIGPPIQDGFYYDFDLPEPIGEGDLPGIEEEMRRIVADDQPFVREEVGRDEALARLDGQPFKREIIESTSCRCTATTAGSTSARDRTSRRPGGSARSD
jgi:threonyl-tRNA synthetase